MENKQIQLTDSMRYAIQKLRKQYKVNTDVLARKLKKNTSFISYLENGKIDKIDYKILKTIILLITDNDENMASEFLKVILNETIDIEEYRKIQIENQMLRLQAKGKINITDAIVAQILDELKECQTTYDTLKSLDIDKNVIESSYIKIDQKFQQAKRKIIDYINSIEL